MEAGLADVVETVADVLGERSAIVHGERRRSWSELDLRAARLAGHLDEHGIGAGSRVAIGLFNGCEYIEVLLAVLKLRATPVNINYRYRAAELQHVLADCDAAAFVFDTVLASRVAEVVDRLDRPMALVQLGGDDRVDGATDLTVVLETTAPLPRQQRGDDEWLLYTGGTTGSPKAVVSSHSWVYRVCAVSSFRLFDEPTPQTLDELATATARRRDEEQAFVCMPLGPLMHGAGLYNAVAALQGGGTLVFTVRGFDPAETIDLVDREGVTDMALVGDAFGRPLAEELERRVEQGRPASLATLRRIRSAGALWSSSIKQRLLRHGRFTCQDMIAASEGGPFAVSIAGPDDPVDATSRFRLAPGARLLDDQGRDVVPGSDVVGVLAAPTDPSIHYLGHPQRTQETFVVVDDQRYCIPGDLAMLDAEGTLVFRGRPGNVINSGGEKVHAEEVEATLLTHPDIVEVVVAGVADDRWGQTVAAVVTPRAGTEPTLEELRDWVGQRLADFKRPGRLVLVDEVRRSPAGKADLRWAAQLAARADIDPSAHTLGGG